MWGFNRRYVLSTAYGHSVGKTVAYGYVTRPAVAGANPDPITVDWLRRGSWAVGDRGVMRDATFHARAPFDPGNCRIHGDYSK